MLPFLAKVQAACLCICTIYHQSPGNNIPSRITSLSLRIDLQAIFSTSNLYEWSDVH